MKAHLIPSSIACAIAFCASITAAAELPVDSAAVPSAAVAPDLQLADHDDAYLYRLPYGDGVSYRVIQSYGSRLSHIGTEFYTVDFGMPIGTPVHAAREGIVVAIEDSQERACWSTGCGRYANHVAIRHSDGTIGEYFHLQKEGVLVRVGDYVERGQAVALSGNTCYTNVPHLHFGVYTMDADSRQHSIDIRFATGDGVHGKLRAGRLYSNKLRAGAK